MRSTPNLSIERHRIRDGPLASHRSYGNNGAFLLPGLTRPLLAVVSDGGGWEHVSISVDSGAQCPTWDEMGYAKDLFWSEDECAVQYHPPRSEYRNLHEGCLHLWRPTEAVMPRPEPMMVAP